eukprot:1358236-Pleurochrysis_carterae.AAC.3
MKRPDRCTAMSANQCTVQDNHAQSLHSGSLHSNRSKQKASSDSILRIDARRIDQTFRAHPIKSSETYTK